MNDYKLSEEEKKRAEAATRDLLKMDPQQTPVDRTAEEQESTEEE
jgi:hypothetical protein